MALDQTVSSIRSIDPGLTLRDYLPSPTKPKPARLYSMAFFIDSVPFTEDVVDGRSSLGGSESACLTLARALGARGHDVHLFVTQLADAVRERPLPDWETVTWHLAEELPSVLPFFNFDLFCSLRMPQAFALRNPSKLTVLWGQDLLVGPGSATTSFLCQVDRLALVSEFHRLQWQEKEPTLLNVPAWVVTNPFEPRFVPRNIRKKGYLIHVSRPERGHDAILHLWPSIRAEFPGIELRLCRYSSMYDAKGFGRVCAMYDQKVKALNDKVGGISWLGELNKPDLYRALSGALAMWYPTSQPWFAETNCLAATEAQACGAPVICDYRGALPETLSREAAVFLDNPGGSERWRTKDYGLDTLAALHRVLDDPARYHGMREAGWRKAATATGAVQAEAWEQRMDDFFATRYQSHTIGILRRLLHDDDHGAARLVALRLVGEEQRRVTSPLYNQPLHAEALDALALCDDVIAQRHSTAEDYARFAVQDPSHEAATSGRFRAVCEILNSTLSEEERQRPLRVLDLACGNGSGILVMSEVLPNAIFLGVDYSEGVLSLAEGACRPLLGDRVAFRQGKWDADAGRWDIPELAGAEPFDVIFCGEFLEHVLHPEHVIDAIESLLVPGGLAILTTPCGPFAELMEGFTERRAVRKGHVHDYTIRDIAHLFSTKDAGWQYMPVGHSVMGSAVGFWLVSFRGRAAEHRVPAPPLDLEHKILTSRPYQRIDVCMIVRNGADWLRPCLKSLYFADRVLVTDTGSTDGSQAICRDLGAEVTEVAWPEDFSVARNLSIARSLQGPDHPDGAEWVLWIDADERLDGGTRVRQYAHGGGPFNAISIRQHHLHIDQPPYFDTPCRLFRTRPLHAHRPGDAGQLPAFYGVVHEQPEIVLGHGLTPALMVSNVNIVHMGYYHGEIRRTKSLDRNGPLLLKEIRGQGTHPPRRIAWAFLMRDLLQSVVLYRGEAMREMREGDQLNALEKARLAKVVALYRDHRFGDPGDLIHDFAFNIYQQALLALDITRHGGVQVAWAFGAGRGEIAAPKPKVFLAMSPEEAETLIARKVHRWLEGLKPEQYRVAPFEPDAGATAGAVEPLPVFVGEPSPLSVVAGEVESLPPAQE